MTRSNTSKDSSRGFQVSSEISFLISARKTLPSNYLLDIKKISRLQLRARLVTKNFHLPFEHMYEALNIIK